MGVTPQSTLLQLYKYDVWSITSGTETNSDWKHCFWSNQDNQSLKGSLGNQQENQSLETSLLDQPGQPIIESIASGKEASFLDKEHKLQKTRLNDSLYSDEKHWNMLIYISTTVVMILAYCFICGSAQLPSSLLWRLMVRSPDRDISKDRNMLHLLPSLTLSNTGIKQDLVSSELIQYVRMGYPCYNAAWYLISLAL